jgi:hypothetical protein
VSELECDPRVESLFFSVQDPEASIPNCPAVTTLLIKVCGSDQDKFAEACRLVNLFMVAAYKRAEWEFSGGF